MKRSRTLRRFFLISFFFLLSFVFPSVSSYAQVGQNSAGDLWGNNLGDQIIFTWVEHEGAVEYIVYRSSSMIGPWQELFRANDVRSGGMKVDITSDARLMELCYRVDAIDANSIVIRSYLPMCIAKYAGRLLQRDCSPKNEL